MPVIRKSLLELIFSGAYLLRWNDKLRPVELLEIDKQAHKMLLACCSGTIQPRRDTAARGPATEIDEGPFLTTSTGPSSQTSSSPSIIDQGKPRQFRELTSTSCSAWRLLWPPWALSGSACAPGT
jgi:putative hydrolase of HD superfamily